MEHIAVSKFKATCLSVLEQVRRTGQPVLVTRRGQAIAEITPPATPPPPRGWLGAMRTTGRIEGDIVAPAAEEAEWDALRS
ncbi:MAG: type II toxin-antitoxin system Phd/YefM family antitoxin [Rhodospirillales bacterium]|nr:type II toxin-antitoxin system Phd/YefM family antitoxin [Rhodospirillales bacterium]